MEDCGRDLGTGDGGKCVDHGESLVVRDRNRYEKKVDEIEVQNSGMAAYLNLPATPLQPPMASPAHASGLLPAHCPSFCS